jgi:cell division protein FtsI (penicillin-binding protein 3)
MTKKENTYSLRIYLVSFFIYLFSIIVLIKLNNIEFVEGNYYRNLAKKNTVKSFVVPVNRGYMYSSDDN